MSDEMRYECPHCKALVPAHLLKNVHPRRYTATVRMYKEFTFEGRGYNKEEITNDILHQIDDDDYLDKDVDDEGVQSVSVEWDDDGDGDDN